MKKNYIIPRTISTEIEHEDLIATSPLQLRTKGLGLDKTKYGGYTSDNQSVEEEGGDAKSQGDLGWDTW